PLLIVDHGRPLMTAAFLSQSPPGLYLTKIRGFASDWSLQIINADEAGASLRLPIKTGGWRGLFGGRHWLKVRLDLIHRGDNTTLVQTRIASTDHSLANDPFVQYSRNFLRLLQSYFSASAVPSGTIRSGERRKIHRSVVLVPVNGGPTDGIECTAVDVSATGMGLVGPALPPDRQVLVYLPGAQSPIPAEVARIGRESNSMYRIGLAFQITDDANPSASTPGADLE
ncbi:MAG: PilZ domain-containing protein, partial [Planctomycetia bacterium]